MGTAIVKLFLWTMIPGLELRASIPVGAFTESIKSVLPLWQVVLICWISNVIIGAVFFVCLGPLMRLMRRWSFFNRLMEKYLDRAQRKLKPGVEKYGVWGFALFIGIPLPMTGAYTGAAGAFALGMDTKKFLVANIIGVTIAAIAVTIVVLLIQAGIQSPIFDWLIKKNA